MRTLKLLLLLLAPVSLLAMVSCQPRQADKTTLESRACHDCNVVLISIDTLRADHLGAYGYHRDTSPKIDRFAASAVLFEKAYSASFHTAESHMSLFTSLPPSVHRIRNASKADRNVILLSEKIRTFAQELKDAGFDTLGIHGGGNLDGVYGFSRGFDTFVTFRQGLAASDADRHGLEHAFQWLDGQKERQDRFFLFYHTYRTHDPYFPAPPYDRMFSPDYSGEISANLEEIQHGLESTRFRAMRDAYWDRVDREDPADIEHLKALYDGQIREVDELIHDLLKKILEDFPRTIIVLTSDHGEEFLEHGRFLHDQLFEELLHVPLIIYTPHLGGGRRVQPRVSSLDLAPTILELLGISPPEQYAGRSLLPFLDPESADVEWRDEALAEKLVPGVRRDTALYAGRHKLIYHGNRQEILFYDLVEDPKEQVNLAPELKDSPAFRQMWTRLNELNKKHDAQMKSWYAPDQLETQELDQGMVDALRELGYLN